MRRTRLTESDLNRIVRRVISEQEQTDILVKCFEDNGVSQPSACRMDPTSDREFKLEECLAAVGKMVFSIGLETVADVISCIKDKMPG